MSLPTRDVWRGWKCRLPTSAGEGLTVGRHATSCLLASASSLITSFHRHQTAPLAALSASEARVTNRTPAWLGGFATKIALDRVIHHEISASLKSSQQFKKSDWRNEDRGMDTVVYMWAAWLCLQFTSPSLGLSLNSSLQRCVAPNPKMGLRHQLTACHQAPCNATSISLSLQRGVADESVVSLLHKHWLTPGP